MSDKRYVLRAMTLEDAHKQGFSTKWFDERAKTRGELEEAFSSLVWRKDTPLTVLSLDDLVSWPTKDGPPR